MKDKVSIEKCSYCGSRNIGEGKQDAYAAVTPQGRVFKSSSLHHVICADCGAVLFSYVDKPAAFMPKDRD